jgi:hypothetical protein
MLAISVVSDLPPRLDPQGRSTEHRENPEGGIKSVIGDGALVTRDNVVLQWTGGPEGSRYNVRVMTEDLRLISSAWSLEKPEYRVPAAPLSDLPSGTKLVWQVDAFSPDQPRITSPTFIIRLR